MISCFLRPSDMRSWLAADYPVWLVIEVVERHLDTSALHGRGDLPDGLIPVNAWKANPTQARRYWEGRT